MFCKKCGNALDDGMNFCPRCGEPAVKPIVQETPPEENDAERDVYEPVETEVAAQPMYPVRKDVIKAPAFMRGGNATTWLAVMFLLSACTMISMILSGVGISVKAVRGFGLSLPATTINGIADNVTAFGVYTVFLVIYIIVNLCAVFMILNKMKYGTIAGIAANAIAVISGIVAVAASFSLSKEINEFVSTFPTVWTWLAQIISAFPTVWTWLALALGLVNGVFLIFKRRDLTA